MSRDVLFSALSGLLAPPSVVVELDVLRVIPSIHANCCKAVPEVMWQGRVSILQTTSADYAINFTGDYRIGSVKVQVQAVYASMQWTMQCQDYHAVSEGCTDPREAWQSLLRALADVHDEYTMKAEELGSLIGESTEE
tara:strand:+ start:15046 stop:15459 length:414 start_codon:yes stop_codon:yes gene_type:complete